MYFILNSTLKNEDKLWNVKDDRLNEYYPLDSSWMVLLLEDKNCRSDSSLYAFK